MRLMIVGQKWLGAELLKQCLQDGHTVAGVLTPPAAGDAYDRLYAAAQQAGVPAQAVAGSITGAHIAAGCDLILCAHAHAYIDASAREAARLGALGFHPSLLPRHRGRDAVRWTIHMRDPIAGGSVYWMDDGADTGPLAAQDWCHVLPTDTADALWRRELAPMALRLFRATLAECEADRVRSEAQDEAAATWEPAFNRRRLREAN